MKQILLLVSIFSISINGIAQHTLDPSFGNNGVAYTFFPPTENISTSLGRQVIALPDGSYYILTAYGSLIHRLANGGNDLNYGENGYSAPFGDLSRAALLPNGKIVIGGTSLINSAFDFLFARLNA